MQDPQSEIVEWVSLLPMDDQFVFPFEMAFIAGDVVVIRTIFGESMVIRDA